MSDESTPREAEKKQIGADLVIPAVALVFTLYFFYTIINWPWNPADEYIAWDARVTAFSIGAILIALIVVFIALNLLAVIRGEASFGFQSLTVPLAMIPRRAALFALTLGFIVFIQWGGFTITTFIFLNAAMMLLTRGKNWKFVLGLSAVLSIGGYFLFIYAFEVRFPKGPFELLMAQVL
jgi:hypothetical protein